MRKLFIIILIIMASYTFAQTNLNNKIERKGFIYGIGFGAGVLTLKTNDTITVAFSPTLPNIKVGYMVNNRLAICALLPGAVYKYNGNTRGFEGFQLAVQYWVKENWWVLGGTGLTFDAPAFYVVKDPKKAEFNTGFPSFSLATGYEIYHKGKFVIDLQYRIFLGKSNLPNNGSREGVSNMFIIGFNLN